MTPTRNRGKLMGALTFIVALSSALVVVAWQKRGPGGLGAILHKCLAFILVGALWGCTNPFLKEGADVAAAKAPTRDGRQTCVERLLHVFTEWRFVLPYALNQLGSVVNVYLLGAHELVLAVPITNALTFVFTALVAIIRGEKGARSNVAGTAMGIMLVCAGVGVCVTSASQGAAAAGEGVDVAPPHHGSR